MKYYISHLRARCRSSNIYLSKHKLPEVSGGSEFAVCGVALFQIERTNCTLDLPNQNLYDPRILVLDQHHHTSCNRIGYSEFTLCIQCMIYTNGFLQKNVV